MKKILTLFLLSSISFALTLDEVQEPRAMQGIISNTDNIEVTLTPSGKKEQKAITAVAVMSPDFERPSLRKIL